jgi:ligand-binding sensor domain-containing protein|tara:strand:+ start:12786 stop:13901 length:1116 start_codon:yes stop_codon:yes gene_type:complete
MNLSLLYFRTSLFFVVLSLTLSCSGQNKAIESKKAAQSKNTSLTIGDTISELEKNIWIVFQDQNENYWFGSDGSGVYQYDGETILHFTSKDGLSNDRIRGIKEDNFGNVFITNLGGIDKFDGEKFTHLTAIESNEWELNPDDIWFSILGGPLETGPYRYDGKTLHHLKFPKHYMEDEYYDNHPNKSWSPYEPYTIFKDSKGNIWFGTSNFGLCRYDGKTVSWLYEEHLTMMEGGGSFGIRSIIEDRDEKFWICNTNYRYDIQAIPIVEKDKILIDYKREKGMENLKSFDGTSYLYFMSAVKDNAGDLWLATYSEGVIKYDGTTTTRYSVKDGEKDVTLFSIYKDKEGNLWLGTHESGVYKFNGNTFGKFKL